MIFIFQLKQKSTKQILCEDSTLVVHQPHILLDLGLIPRGYSRFFHGRFLRNDGTEVVREVLCLLDGSKTPRVC